MGVTLSEAAADMSANPNKQMQKLMEYLGAGLANAVNFIRPDRLVIASPLVQNNSFSSRLEREVRDRLLGPISDRLRFDLWPLSDEQPSVKSLGWLVLAPIYLDNWPVQQAGMVETNSDTSLNGRAERKTKAS